MLKYTCICFLLILFLSCNEKNDKDLNFYNEEIALHFNDSLKLNFLETISLPLDKADFWSHSISYINEGEASYLSVINQNNNSINVYNLDKQVLYKTFNLQVEGPNGVGDLDAASGHALHSLDSLYIYNVMTGRLFLMDSTGVILNYTSLFEVGKTPDLPMPVISSLNPMVFTDRQILIPCGINRVPEDFSVYPSIISIDKSLNNKRILNTYPSIYENGYWGTSFKYQTSIQFVPKSNKLIINYPISHSLEIVDIDSNEKNYIFAGSKEFREIQYFKSDPKFPSNNNMEPYWNERKEFSLTNSDYTSIIYDKYKDIYYRIAYIRPSLFDYRSGNRTVDISLIILDKNLKKVGEQKIDGKIYDISMLFVSNKGINIARKDLFEKNENFISYDLFSIVPKKL